MFAIATQEKQYKTYILSDEKANSKLEVVPDRGGIITQWQVNGKEILYLDTERFTHPDLSIRGGIPILFPICGNLPDNTYTYQGKEYHLKQHGFARDLPWQVISQETLDAASISLVLFSSDRTLAVYPFHFELAFTYKIKGNTLEIRQRYTNHGSETMPFSTGLHPYFLTTDKTQLSFQIPACQYQDQRTKEIKTFKGNFDFNNDEIDIAFSNLTSKTATVIDASRQLQLDLNYGSETCEVYSKLVFWTLKGKDFYCLEPWSAARNALNTGENLILLPPKDSLEIVFRLSVQNY